MMERLSSRVWASLPDASSDRPALGYVRGDRRSLAVDGGNSPAQAALLQAEETRLRLPAPSFVCATHAHWDHVLGLCAWDAPVVASRPTQAGLLRLASWAWTPEAMAERLARGEDIRFCHDNILREYRDPREIRVRTADVVFERTLDIALGGVTARLLLLPSSHTDDCVVVYLPEERVLFLGDIAYEDLHHAPPCWHASRSRALREALAGLDFSVAVPGHQMPLDRKAFFADLDASLRNGAPMLP